MAKVNKEIKENYDIYTQIVEGDKTLPETEISLQGTKSNAKWLETNNNLEGTVVDHDKLSLKTKCSIEHATDYGFKVFAKSLTEKPVFRFDADGTRHDNQDDTLPLLERVVDTPHFHKWKSNGIEIAYKTTHLIDNKEEVQNDIQKGAEHFCEEAKITSINGLPKVSKLQTDLYPKKKELPDVNKGIDFI